MWKVRKRGKNYHIDVNVDGQRVRRAAGTTDKRLAEQVARRVEQELIEQLKLGDRPVYTWSDAVVRWIKETERSSFNTDRPRLRALDPYLRTKPLDQINASLVWSTVEAIADQKNLSSSTQNKYMGLVRAILNSAKAWEWIDSTPALRSKNEPGRRVRWITEGEARRLIAALPKNHKNPVRFALATGLRKANVYGLTWSQVDLSRRLAWIYGDQAKAGRDIRIPLNQAAVDVLRQQIGADHNRVFSCAPVNSQTWKNACKTAGILNFRFHDLRHTWASWHVMNGTTLQELMELGGWANYEMVIKYAHLSDKHLSAASENIGTNLSQCAVDKSEKLFKAARGLENIR